jgi:excisionase family DNA binding protein
VTDILAAKYWTVEEVAAHLRVSKMTVYRLIQDAELGSVRIGRVFRVPEDALREYLER